METQIFTLQSHTRQGVSLEAECCPIYPELVQTKQNFNILQEYKVIPKKKTEVNKPTTYSQRHPPAL